MITFARLAVALGLNLNWVFDPVWAYRCGERVRMERKNKDCNAS